MEENKNINPTPEAENAVPEISEKTVETAEAAETTETTETVKTKKPKKSKIKKEKLLKNEILFKKGSYSIALTAIVLVAIIVFNVLVTALSERFVLEFDMTSEKKNSISAENIDYIKKVDRDVEIIVCAAEDTYVNYVGSSAQQLYGVSYDSSVAEYYEQTVKLINKYHAYNDKIDVRFVDPQSSEFTSVTAQYSADNLSYGDIIVSTGIGDAKKFKKIGFKDVYALREDETYAAYGMTMANITGNNIETALTSAVAYVLSDIDINVAFLTGHSSADYTESYQTLLKNNNYSVDVISDKLVTNIDSKYDLIVIPAASKDFVESELTAISDFLDNDGKFSKGMVVYLDATAPYLENFYDFLGEWGVDVGEGILFETNEDNHMPNDPTILGSYNTGADESLKDLQLCISGLNVPLKPAFETKDYMTVSSLMETPETVVAAPKGSTADWDGADKYKASAYSTVVETVKSTYDDDNNEISSRVSVFASTYFLESDYNETASVSNKNMTLAAAERASGGNDMGISFVSKSISNETYIDSVTESSAGVMRIIFMFILPLTAIAAGIIIFVKRRNA